MVKDAAVDAGFEFEDDNGHITASVTLSIGRDCLTNEARFEALKRFAESCTHMRDAISNYVYDCNNTRQSGSK